MITHAFPHWFCQNFERYGAPDPSQRPGNEAELPVDQHQLIAMIAPRPVYVASAEEDLWADPKGEWLAAVAAEPAYRLLGTAGFGVERDPLLLPDASTSVVPAVNAPVGVHSGNVAYHRRSGVHDVTSFDWDREPAQPPLFCRSQLP